MKDYYYSATTNVFYYAKNKPDYDKVDGWPDDAVLVDNLVYDEFGAGVPPDGKTRGPDRNGMPSWVDVPEPSHDDLIAQAEDKKSHLLAEATTAISPLQDAVELDIATDEEKTGLMNWKKYRVLVNRIDVSTAPNIEWPEKP